MSRIMVVSPHLDDEVIGCGGTIARHVAEGDHVTVCVVANRVYGHKYDEAAIREELEDCRKAQEVLGYQELFFFGEKDERVGETPIETIVHLEKAVADVRPAVMYIPWRGDTNQDHRAVFDAAMVVCRPHAGNGIGKVYAYENMSTPSLYAPFTPNYHISIGRYLDQKMKAMGCYRRESRAWPHPRSEQGIAIKARQRGMEVGLDAAEAFMVLRGLWNEARRSQEDAEGVSGHSD